MYFLHLPFAILIIAGLIVLLHDKAILVSGNKYIITTIDFSRKLYNYYNIPLAIISTIIFVLYFAFEHNAAHLFIVSILTLFSIGIQYFIDNNGFVIAQKHYETDYNHNKLLYNYLDTIAISQSIKNKIILEIQIEQERYQKNEFEKTLENTYTTFDSYLSLQKSEVLSLLESKDSIMAVNSILKKASGEYNNILKTLKDKVAYIEKVIEFTGNSDELIKDINTSFRQAYDENNKYLTRQIYDIIETINGISTKTNIMQTLPKTYIDVNDYYSRRMVHILNTIENVLAQKQKELLGLVESCNNTILQKEKTQIEVTKQLIQYVLKNNFVLTKIMETHPSMNLNIKKLIDTQKNKKLKRKKYCNYCGHTIDELGDQCANCGNSVYVGH